MLVVRVLCALLSLAAAAVCGDGGGGAGSAARGEGRVVNTAQGAVRGYRSARGDYYEFHGIPYATVPKGRDKFKGPLPPPEWSNVFDATNDQIACPQPRSELLDLVGGTQQVDCLVVNVFVPNIVSDYDKPLPVLVYIHGGGFNIGRGNMLAHKSLIRHGIIVVNFNYRVGAHGFLCLGTNDIPGNAGLKDQIAALKWVKRNIGHFGGNPNEVTIGGFSAGSASVELLMLSPMAKNLFAKALSDSGSALADWVVDPDPLIYAKRFALNLAPSKDLKTVTEIEEFYKSLSMDQLLSKINNNITVPDTTFGFSPCVERIIEDQESFLNVAPLTILKSGNYNMVPYMTGFTSEEGLFRIHLFDQWQHELEDNFVEFLPRDLKFPSEDKRYNIANEVKLFYFYNQSISLNVLKQYVDYFTDVMFSYSTIRSARLHVGNGLPLYLYEYSYIPSENQIVPHPYSDKIQGAPHCAQVWFLHSLTAITSGNKSETDRLVLDRMSMMWSNFIKYGAPIQSVSELLPVTWDTMDAKIRNYLSMDFELKRKEGLLGERVEFWDGIYKDYYRIPQSPDMTRLYTGC